MEDFVFTTITEMYAHCRRGISMNFITTYVDYKYDFLFYMSPARILDFCRKNFSRHIVIRHDYPLWEYSVFVYNPEFIKQAYGYYK
jgi:hypothetical protein